MTRPLEGIRVLDFSHVLAGPFATRILGDMGADVVKVNSEARATGVNLPTHPYFLLFNRSKRSLALDIGNEEGRAVARKLCDEADVVINNFSVGVLKRWGIDFETVRESNPGVIYTEMSGMGDGGPWSKFVTYAPTIHALSGLTHLTGVPGREDIGIGFSYNDHQAGLHAVVAVLAAIEARRRTGKGQRVDMSQFEVGVNFAGPSLLDWFANGVAARPTGNKLPYDDAAPHNCYRCADVRNEVTDYAETKTEDERWVAIACMDDEQWRAFRAVMGDPEWSSDSRYTTAAGRVALIDELDQAVSAWTKNQIAEEVMAKCQQSGVPAGVVQNGIDLVEEDPQLAAYNFIQPLSGEHPQYGTVLGDRLPLHFGATPCDEFPRSRELGEDNETVLSDWLGMTADEIKHSDEIGILK
jgi:crotonobetainyl-CoA:carnitine CoA-transferase CaiB-like acyl-CoA transferase